jgi:hypothetical protein
MKNSIRIAVAAGVFAGMVMGPAPLRADEESDHDMAVKLEAMQEQINGLKNSSFDMSNTVMEGFADIRYDDLKAFAPVSNTLSGTSGFYARRAEFKLSGYLGTRMIYSLGFDFTELKHKDLGVEILDVPVLPFVDAPDYAWSIKIGQYRQPFGISPQTSSSAIMFAERPMWNGGANQVGGTKLIAERVMGIQARQKVKYSGILSYDLQFGGFNNALDDQAAGTNAIQVGSGSAPQDFKKGVSDFAAQKTDEALSWIGRFSFTWDFLNGMLPEKSKVQTGVSYIYDSANTVWMATTNAARRNNEVVGTELVINLGPQISWQSEWVGLNNGFGFGATVTHKEGWNSDLSIDSLPWICSTVEKGDKLEWIFRLDEESNYVAGFGAQRLDRIGAGLKWSYLGGKNHTSIDYFVDAPEQQFGGDFRTATGNAPATTLILQQQFAFDTGKPTPRVKEEE